MYDYNPKTWLSLIFHSYSRQVVRTLMPALVLIGLFTWLVCYVLLEKVVFHEKPFITTIAMHSLLGVVLGLFLVFRVNSAYDRWWEGRKLWGLMVNNTRNFSMKLNAFTPKNDTQLRLWFVQTIGNLAMSLRNHLQGKITLKDLEEPGEGAGQVVRDWGHMPNYFSSSLYEKINQLYMNKEITNEQFFLIDKEMKEFADIVGGCERIRNTPIPYSYAMYIKKFIFVYIITLPLGFVTTSGYMTIPIVMLTSFLLLSVELIAEEIENPFGEDLNDLPIYELALKIRKDSAAILK